MRYGKAKDILPDIKCPFYMGMTEKSITCEGIDIAYKNMSMFSSREKCMIHIEKYCKCFPNKCYVADAINRKYEEKKR